MSGENLRQLLIREYRERDLSAGVAARLARLAAADVHGGRATTPKARSRLRFGAGYLLAASIGLLLGLVAYAGFEKRAVAEAPRYAVVKFHVDGCPLSAITEPVFAKFVQDFEGKVAPVRLEIANDVQRRLSRSLCETLRMRCVYDGGVESGMIKVVDRATGKIIGTLTREEQLPELEETLRKLIP